MQQFIEQFEPWVTDDKSALLLAPAEHLHQVACRFSPTGPPAGVDATLPADARRFLIDMSPRRRREFLAGRYCAAKAMALAGENANQWVARADDHRPLWPVGLTGSISHTDCVAIAIAASTQYHQSVGVDAETVMSPQTAGRLAGKILAGYPYSDGFFDFPLMVTLVFSVKEALFKALYPLCRIDGGFDSADIVEWDYPRRSCEVRLRQPIPKCQDLQDCYEAHYVFDETQVQVRVTTRAL